MIPTVLPTYNRAPLAFSKGEGSWLVATDGTRYLDLGAGIAVNALGHANPDLIAALTEQAAKVWHVSNLYQIPEQQRLADLLVDNTFADTVFFTNSGTEAAELAIKMARKYWYEKGEERTGILTFEGSFHGRSTGAIAAAASEKMVKGFGPLMPGFVHLKWPVTDADHAAIRAAITTATCAVIIEPIQGEGGIRVVPDQCLKGLRDLCDETGTLLIFDEVQCGMGRTGRLFAHEWAGVTPDIMMVAKGIGGGFPLGAVLATERAASGMTAGTHGSTYGGNPLGCAVSRAALAVLRDEELCQKSAQLGAPLLERLRAIRSPYVREIRGRGLLIGIELDRRARPFCEALAKRGVLCKETHDMVLRIAPPLVVRAADLDWAVEQFAEVLAG